MNNFQFGLALVGAITGFMGAAWIISQAISRGREAHDGFLERLIDTISTAIEKNGAGNPEYERRLNDGDRRMENIARQIEGLQETTGEDRMTLRLLKHSIANFQQRMEGLEYKLENLPEKIVHLLRGKKD